MSRLYLQLVEPLDSTLIKDHIRDVVLEELVDCRIPNVEH